jgi:hypothetical protein
LQGGGVFSVVVGLYDDPHVLIEGDEEAQKALHAALENVNSGTSAALQSAEKLDYSCLSLFRG